LEKSQEDEEVKELTRRWVPHEWSSFLKSVSHFTSK